MDQRLGRTQRIRRIALFGIGAVAGVGACAGAGPLAEPDGPQVRVGPPHAVEAVAVPRATDLGSAVRTLDTLYVPTAHASATERGLLESIRLVRRGDLAEAASTLAPVDPHDPATPLAQGVRGQLLVHEGLWSDLRLLAPPTGEPGGLAHTFLSDDPEEVVFEADETVIPLFRSAVGTPVVEVVIGDVPRRFWVDTGAGLTVVTASLAAELGLVEGPGDGIAAGTATSRAVAVQPVVVPEIRLGEGVQVRRHPAIVIQDEDLSFELPGRQRLDIEGIIGWNLIRNLDLTLDPTGQRALIRRPAPEPRGPRNLLWFGYPLVVAHKEDGVEMLFGLDTGAASSALAERFLEGLEVGPLERRTRRVGGAGGFEEVEVQVVPEAVVLIDGNRVEFTTIDAQPIALSPIAELHGVLGADLAGDTTVRIDWLNGRFELQP